MSLVYSHYLFTYYSPFIFLVYSHYNFWEFCVFVLKCSVFLIRFTFPSRIFEACCILIWSWIFVFCVFVFCGCFCFVLRFFLFVFLQHFHVLISRLLFFGIVGLFDVKFPKLFRLSFFVCILRSSYLFVFLDLWIVELLMRSTFFGVAFVIERFRLSFFWILNCWSCLVSDV